MHCRRRPLWAHTAGMLIVGILPGPLTAQESGGPAPDPARASPTLQEHYRPGETYDTLQAGQDAYRAAEAERQAAIQRQLRVEDDTRWYNSWMPGHSYKPAWPDVYGYAVPRAYRRVYPYRYGPLLAPWPGFPADAYASPYQGGVRQPTGHEKVWSSPNGYVYRPRYDPPVSAASAASPRAGQQVPRPPVPHPPKSQSAAPTSGGNSPPPPAPEPLEPKEL